VAAIELDGLERRYGERVALAGVSVRVEEGQTLAVLGGNGAGKTTLLRVLAGLLRPHGGGARVLGAELPSERWRLPGPGGHPPPQPPPSPRPGGPAEPGPPPRPAPRGAGGGGAGRTWAPRGRRRGGGGGGVPAVRARGGGGPRAAARIRELSRGLVQRLAAARAVLHDPPLLLLDEPRANLDPAAAELLEPLIGRASGRTRVLVSHDVQGALAESDVVLRLRRGRPVSGDEELYR